MGETRPSAVPDVQSELASLRVTVDALMDAVVITSADLGPPGPIIETVNPAFCRMTGYAAEELIGQSPRILQGPLTDRALLDRLRVDLVERELFSGQAVNYRKDGAPYQVEWLIAPVRDGAGRVVRWVSVQRDVTERERMQARELVLLTELQRRVRNVLGIVRHVARETGETSPSVEDYWAHLDGRLAVMARIASHPPGPFDVQDLFRDEFHGHRIADDRYTLEGPDVGVNALAGQALALAVHELVVNAIKFGAFANDTGRVTISWRVEPTDDGPRLQLDWRETGGAPVDEPAAAGYGSAFLSQYAPRQLNGEARLVIEKEGVSYSLAFPLAAPPRQDLPPAEPLRRLGES